MRCIDCIEKEEKHPNDAEIYLINEYDSVRPLCRNCYDEYAYMDGDNNLDSYSIEIIGLGQDEFIKRINVILEYLNDMNKRYSDKYFAAKKWLKTPNAGLEDLEKVLEW